MPRKRDKNYLHKTTVSNLFRVVTRIVAIVYPSRQFLVPGSSTARARPEGPFLRNQPSGCIAEGELGGTEKNWESLAPQPQTILTLM